MLRFTPPKEEAKNLPRYASYVVASGLKVHGRIVDAKNSWRNRGWSWQETGELIERYGSMRPERKHLTKHGFILENVEGLWFTLYEIKPGLTEEELPWYKDVWVHNDWGWTHLEEPSYGTDKYTKKRKSFPMTRDEYVAWRLAVQKELDDSRFALARYVPAEDATVS